MPVPTLMPSPLVCHHKFDRLKPEIAPEVAWQQSTKMAADFSDDAAAEAATITVQMKSAAMDAASLMVHLGEELPVVKPVLKTLKTFREKVETVKSNRKGLGILEERCTYVIACIIVKCRQHPSLEMDVTPHSWTASRRHGSMWSDVPA